MAEYTTAASMGENKAKIKTPFAKIIVNNNPEKTYYNLMWWQDGGMHIGFGSANLSFVRKWLNEEFEVERPAADVAPVIRCKDCKHGKPGGEGIVFCGHPEYDLLEGMIAYADDHFCGYGERRG